MSRCRDCQYAKIGSWQVKAGTVEVCCCGLTRVCTQPDIENDCNCFNRDLSEYDICYNCKYYIGGGDWGLFCSHKDMYHHLGKFDDEPCERYEKKG